MNNLVKGFGSKPNNVMMIGEAPGREEYSRKRPFVGRAGCEQEGFLNFHGLSSRFWYLTNIIPEYTEGNPDPTPQQIARWTPVLEQEIREVSPKLIVAVGAFATKWFLGEAAEMNTVHGCLCLGGEFDRARKNRSNGAYVLPVYHPARGLHDSSARGVIGWDYSRVADIVKVLKTGRSMDLIRTHGYEYKITGRFEDRFKRQELYWDTTGQALSDYLNRDIAIGHSGVRYIGLDTEGTPDDTWSIQISIHGGGGAVLRCSQPDFVKGIDGIRKWVGLPEQGTVIVAHNAPYDITMSLAMGLDLRRHQIFDPMYAAYLLRVEPQSLSALAWRLFRGNKVSFAKFVGKAARSKQVKYLQEVVEADFLAQEPFDRYQNDGSFKSYKPSSISSKAAGILKDMDVDGTRREPPVYELVQLCKKDGKPRKKKTRVLVREGDLIGPKLDKDGNPPDPQKRWHAIYKQKNLTVTGLPAEPFTLPAERELGPMPTASLADMPLRDAVEYAAKDADYALRAVKPLTSRMKQLGVWELFQRRMKVVEPFREIQQNGLLGDRDEFIRLSIEMTAEMDSIREELSERFFNGEPINPISSKDVNKLLKRRGLKAKKTTKIFYKELKSGETKQYGGSPSTATDSIAHLKFTDQAVDLVFRWRHVQHDRDAFVLPAIKRMDPFGPRYQYVTCEVATTRTPTGRLRMKDPNLQQVPTRRGPAIRRCYTCEPGEMLVTADLAQIEWRVAAWLSQDMDLIKEIVDGIDTHTSLASRVFGVPFDEVDGKTQRAPAKTVRFLMNYGGGPSKLQDKLWEIGLVWDLSRCEQIFKDAAEAYPVLGAHIEGVIDKSRREGMIRDIWGMVNYLWPSDDSKVDAENGRKAWSYRDSGTAQGILQNSMVWLRDQIWILNDQGIDIKWRLQLHDEVMFSCPEEYADLLGGLMIVALTQHHGCEGWNVPIEAEWAKAKTWGELK